MLAGLHVLRIRVPLQMIPDALQRSSERCEVNLVLVRAREPDWKDKIAVMEIDTTTRPVGDEFALWTRRERSHVLVQLIVAL